jgi:hypothetical protein
VRVISTNHFQAPVRRFVLELFDIEIGPHTLPRLTHLEKGSFTQGPRHPDPQKVMDTNANGSGTVAAEEESEANRRRARSSPGPEPPVRHRRGRGLTVGEPPTPDIFSPAPPVPPLPRSSVDPLDVDVDVDAISLKQEFVTPTDTSSSVPENIQGSTIRAPAPMPIPIPTTPSSATSQGPPVSPTTMMLPASRTRAPSDASVPPQSVSLRAEEAVSGREKESEKESFSAREESRADRVERME